MFFRLILKIISNEKCMKNMPNKNLKKKTLTTYNKYDNKNFPPSTREWKNSIYVYNKNALNLIPVTSNLAIKLIKSYLYFFSLKLEKIRKKKRMLRRFRKLATTRIYSSKGEYMHTNNKVTITLNTYNKQNYNILRIIKKNIINKFKGSVKFLKKKVIKKTSNAFNKKSLLKIKNKSHFRNLIFKKVYGNLFLKKNKSHFRNLIFKKVYGNLFYKKRNRFLLKEKFLLKKANFKKFFILKALNNRNVTISKKSRILYFQIFYLKKFFSKYTKKILKKFKLYFFYKQIYYINKSKFNYTYLQYLTSILNKLYNKNIEYNIINLKYFYLNSDILSEIFTLKIRKNRRKTIRFLKKIIKKIKLGKSYKSIYNPEIKNKKNFIYNTLKCSSSGEKKKKVLNLIKYKKLTGVRLEASGRLTRRYTASRSVYRYKYKGNLLNKESSYNNISSVLLKGNQRSNLQYSFIKHNTRIGSFGIKGWISGN